MQPGAKRIISSSNFDDLITTAFINPDGSIIVISLNSTEDPVHCKVWMDKRFVSIVMSRRSIITVVI
ncbi:MAG: hypothetical protein JW894_11085 [Bacteroidales bacterium]|nr:hypothetical protein [Bacteroidales bacterium]